MKSALAFVGFALAVIVVLFLFPNRGPVPSIPDDFFHAGITNNAACLTCHTPGRQAPLKDTHPPVEECFSCHLHRAS